MPNIPDRIDHEALCGDAKMEKINGKLAEKIKDPVRDKVEWINRLVILLFLCQRTIQIARM